MKTAIFTLLILLRTFNSFSQSVTTFFSDPTKKLDDGIILDNQGNLYGSHFMGSNIYKVTPAGVATIFATGFNTPNGIGFDSQYNLYVCDLSGNRIYKLSHSGAFLDTFNVSTPSGIIKSFNSDTMIFTQYNGDKLSKLAPDGTITLIASGSPMLGSIGMTYDNSGQLYIANFTNRKIYSVTQNNFLYIATVPGPVSGGLGYITFAQGNLWGTSYSAHKIYKVFQNFTDSVALFSGSTAGSIDGPVSTAKFSSPNGIISSVTGDSLYVSDFGTGKVRLISLSSSVGISEKSRNTKLNIVYPNPTKDSIHIVSREIFEKIEIIDSNGKIVMTSIDNKINVSNLTNGEYIVKIYVKGKIEHSKFLKL